MSETINIISKVFAYHDGQSWGDHDYSYHLSAVMLINKWINGSENSHYLALMHDLLEDTEATEADIHDIIPSHASLLLPCLRLLSRNLSQGEMTYQEYINYVAENGHRDAVTVKLSDAIANYSLSRHNGSTLISRYSKSIPVLWRVVFDEEPAWWKINRIADTLFP